MKRYVLSLLAFCVTLGLPCAPLYAQEQGIGQPPVLQAVEPRGLQAGETTTVTLRGDRLAGEISLLLPFSAESRRTDDGARPKIASFEVTIPDDVPPGYYPLRLQNADGLSVVQYVAVDGLANAVAGQTEHAELPWSITGDVRGDKIDETQFAGHAEVEVTIEVEAQRLGSNLRPVIELLRPDGNVLAVAHGIPHLGGDCRLNAKLPADGTYTIRVHDVLYRGGRPGFYRLKVGDFAYADAIIPFAVSAKQEPGDEPLAVKLLGRHASPRKLVLGGVPDIAGTYALRNMTESQLSGRSPQLFVREETTVTEQEAAASESPLEVPLGVNGVLAAAGETDTYRYAVKPGEKIHLEIIAERAGLPLDSVLQVKTADGRVLANADDHQKTRDSLAIVDVPANVSEIHVTVTDRMRRGGAEFAYYVFARRADVADFSLTFDATEIAVPSGSQTVLLIKAQRRGYAGPIGLRFSPALPQEFEIANAFIPSGRDQALLTIHSQGDSSSVLPEVELVGEAQVGDKTIQRLATRATDKVVAYSPWIARQTPLLTIRERALNVAWQFPADETPAPGETAMIEMELQRHEGVPGNVRLQLLTSQVVPLFDSGPNNGKPQEAKAIRLAEAVSIAADAPHQRSVSVMYPADLPMGIYDIALVAELLSADGKSVLDRAVTPAERINVIGPEFEIALNETPQPITAIIGAGEATVLSGRIKRTGGLQGPISLSLSGLPEGWVPPEIQVPQGTDEFAFPLQVPAANTAKPTAALDVQLTGTAMAGERVITAKNSVPLKIAVTSGQPTALLTIFEDEQNFIARLTEGGGQALLHSADRYSGESAVRVTPDQRFRTQLPGLGIQINENPGEGEYRYLRFAWKKSDGANILLQLNSGGQWGPLFGADGPSFRYQAGKPRPDIAAMLLSDQLPTEWVVVTRDLFADFGEFRLDGIALTPGDGQAALFDHIYLAREEEDFADCPNPAPANGQ